MDHLEPHPAEEEPKVPTPRRTEAKVPIRTRTRLFTRIWFSSVNALAAAGVCLLFAACSAGLSLGALLLAGIPGALVTLILVTIPAYILVRSATAATIYKTPSAPFAVILAPCVAIALVFILMISVVRPNRLGSQLGWLMASSAATVTILAFASSRGTANGLIRRYGQPREGVGATCSRCLYDLRGISAHTPCPECGGAFRFEWARE